VFASRTGWDLTPTRLAAALAARREAGLQVYDLTESNPTRCGLLGGAEQLLGALAHTANLWYEPAPLGLESARAAVARYYADKGAAVPLDRICLTASTSEGYAFLFRLLADPGDEVLVPRPSYPLLDFLTGVNDVQLVPYPLVYDGAWRMDLDTLRQAAGPRVRAIVAVNPNNPTGSFVRAEERDALVDFSRERGLALIVDEVFGDYPFKGVDGAAPTLAGTAGALTFVLNGLSKVAALPQMKLAWIAASGPEDLVRPALDRLEVIADTYLSVGTPIQRALPPILAARSDIQQKVLARLRANWKTLTDRLARGGPVEALHTEGGWYAILRLPAVQDDEAWALRLLDEDGVHVHPGYLFDFPDPGHMVVSLLPSEEIFAEGVARLLARAPVA